MGDGSADTVNLGLGVTAPGNRYVMSSPSTVSDPSLPSATSLDGALVGPW
jgi:hypothetical protein